MTLVLKTYGMPNIKKQHIKYNISLSTKLYTTVCSRHHV